MIRSPILKVLSTMRAHRVQALLMGQACIFYGAAEFSRDTDLAVLASAENLELLNAALRELQADCIAVPPLSAAHLERGHGVHFRCQHPEAKGMRVDVMSVLRGLQPFPDLWARRTTVTAPDGAAYELLSLPDLVVAKKTQRDKDWPMVRRLLEAHYFQHRDAATPTQVRFWLLELRTPSLLIELVAKQPAAALELGATRSLLAVAAAGREEPLTQALLDEERREREIDREYWKPLKAELERFRLERGKG